MQGGRCCDPHVCLRASQSGGGRVRVNKVHEPALTACLVSLQLPHFLSLAWLCRGDYARGGYRMLSLVDASGKRTAACCLRNSLYLMPAGLLAYQLGVASSWFATEAGIMAGGACFECHGTASYKFTRIPVWWYLERQCVGWRPNQ